MLALVLTCCLTAGCGREPFETVYDLAAALEEQGVAPTVTETAALPRVQAGGMRLLGPDLDVELYRIEDERERKLAVTAAVLVAGTQKRMPGVEPLRPYLREPFLILVRSEPQAGAVEAALRRVFEE